MYNHYIPAGSGHYSMHRFSRKHVGISLHIVIYICYILPVLSRTLSYAYIVITGG